MRLSSLSPAYYRLLPRGSTSPISSPILSQICWNQQGMTAAAVCCAEAWSLQILHARAASHHPEPPGCKHECKSSLYEVGVARFPAKAYNMKGSYVGASPGLSLSLSLFLYSRHIMMKQLYAILCSPCKFHNFFLTFS